MMYKNRTFMHPSKNGYTETVGLDMLVPLMLLGPIYLIYKRAWVLALILSPIIAISVLIVVGFVASAIGGWAAFIVWFIVLAGAYIGMLDYIAENYLKRGWIELSDEGRAALSRPATPTPSPPPSKAMSPEPRAAAYCVRCGAGLASGAKFCGACGNPVETVSVSKTPEARIPVFKETPPAPEPLRSEILGPTRECGHCKEIIPKSALVCRYCGNRQNDDWPKPDWLKAEK